MEIVANTEYQDIYRIKFSVLLVVNKFKRIDYSDKTDRTTVRTYHAKVKKYNKMCQDYLRELKEDYYDSWSEVTIPKGTVLYCDVPVEITTDKSQYEYQIKTSGDYFSGNSEKMIEYIDDIINIIKSNA